MTNTSLPPGSDALFDLLEHWHRGELTLKEVLSRWPPPDASRDELVRELLHLILILHTRIAAMDGIGDW